MSIALRPATVEDIPFIMACETRPGYAAFVGAWPDDQHRATMADPERKYLIGTKDGTDRGFVILDGVADRNRNMLLKRIAVHDANTGFGKPFLAAVIDWVFTNANTHRLQLEVVEENARARHVYLALGFTEEGLLRECYDHPETGARENMIQMSILKPEWKR
jgi:diamine N-acetyltransferase